VQSVVLWYKVSGVRNGDNEFARPRDTQAARQRWTDAHDTLPVCRPVRQAPWMLGFRNRGCARSLQIPTPATW
ncbi:unnamed protein product, partial [Ectocarpus sp. 8 AP-2014]